ncbi:MAG: hypothetical protein WD069_12590 [Planctomycetales bacterium]
MTAHPEQNEDFDASRGSEKQSFPTGSGRDDPPQPTAEELNIEERLRQFEELSSSDDGEWQQKMPFHIGWPTFLLTLAGFAVLWGGYEDWVLASKSKTEPDRLTVAELMAGGQRDNLHVSLRDHQLVLENAVVKTTTVVGQQVGGWSHVWTPVHSVDDSGELLQPAPGGWHVVASIGATNEEELLEVAFRDELRGTLVNDVTSLEKREKELLQQGMPGVDFDKCWILSVDQTPPSSTSYLGFLGGGFALVAAGLFFARGRGKWFF